MSKAFEFELGQRVNVPSAPQFQGLIIYAQGAWTGMQIYRVQWIAENCEIAAREFTEQEMREVNPSAEELLAREQTKIDAAVADQIQKRFPLVTGQAAARKPAKPRKGKHR